MRDRSSSRDATPFQKGVREAGEGQGCWGWHEAPPPSPTPPSCKLHCCWPSTGSFIPGKGLQLAGASGNTAVRLLFCFRENGIIDCCGYGLGAHDGMLGKCMPACVCVCVPTSACVRVCMCVCPCPYSAGQGQASAQWVTAPAPALPLPCPGPWPLGAREDARWPPGMLMVPCSAGAKFRHPNREGEWCSPSRQQAQSPLQPWPLLQPGDLACPPRARHPTQSCPSLMLVEDL